MASPSSNSDSAGHFPDSTRYTLAVSRPEVAGGGGGNRERKLSEQGKVLMQTEAEYKVPYSRSFTEKTASGHSRPGSTLDTRHVHVYLRRQGSRTSVYSTTSAGLANSDNISLASSSSPHSRPVSAEGNALPAQKLPPSNANTRLVLPNPSTSNRLLPPATPVRGSHALTGTLPRSASIPTLRRRPSYLDELVCQVLDYLFMGGIEAAYNANLLCRLNIEYLIDISNVEPLKVPRNKRSDCPCLCSLETAHSRARMTIMIDESNQLDLVPYFDDVNRFIDSARALGKSVLVHSYNGRNRCGALVVQYLMKTKHVNLERAIEVLRGIKGDISIGENFLRSLRKWESILQQRRGGAVEGGSVGGQNLSTNATVDRFSIGATSASDMTGQSVKRSAWM